MEINVIGAGVTGSATAETLKRLGHIVRICDANPNRQLEMEELGFLPLSPGIGLVTFFCVPEWNTREALASASPESIWVVRSTTKPGETAAMQEHFGHHIVHMPEFLREATALADAISPDRIVIGECCEEHGAVVEDIFTQLFAPCIRVDSVTSELVKLVSNAHLSTLISFWNEIQALCGAVRVNSTVVGKIVSMDHRISTYGAVLHGRPFGGFCLPKDLDSIIAAGKEFEMQPLLLESVREVNQRLWDHVEEPALPLLHPAKNSHGS